MIVLIICIHGQQDSLLDTFEAVSGADGTLGHLDVCEQV